MRNFPAWWLAIDPFWVVSCRSISRLVQAALGRANDSRPCSLQPLPSSFDQLKLYQPVRDRAERRKIPQVAFGPNRRLGFRGGFRRNEPMPSLQPRHLLAFPGNGILERLVIEAKVRRACRRRARPARHQFQA